MGAYLKGSTHLHKGVGQPGEGRMSRAWPAARRISTGRPPGPSLGLGCCRAWAASGPSPPACTSKVLLGLGPHWQPLCVQNRYAPAAVLGPDHGRGGGDCGGGVWGGGAADVPVGPAVGRGPHGPPRGAAGPHGGTPGWGRVGGARAMVDVGAGGVEHGLGGAVLAALLARKGQGPVEEGQLAAAALHRLRGGRLQVPRRLSDALVPPPLRPRLPPPQASCTAGRQGYPVKVNLACLTLACLTLACLIPRSTAAYPKKPPQAAHPHPSAGHRSSPDGSTAGWESRPGEGGGRREEGGGRKGPWVMRQRCTHRRQVQETADRGGGSPQAALQSS
jgi:hypothetical protein